MLITPAYAQAASSDMQTQIIQFAPIVLIFIVFYFFMIRPQGQKAKALRAAQAGLRRGDRIITAGGIIGSVSRVITDDEVEVTIAENVRVRILRSTITTILAKPEPSQADKPGKPSRPAIKGKAKPVEEAPEAPEAEAEAQATDETVSTPPGGQNGKTAG
jgi:preprotein translocase subunit YajC